MAIIRAPTASSLPNKTRIPSTAPSLAKLLGRHSRQALIELALAWLDDRNVEDCPPYLQSDAARDINDEETLPYPAAETIEDIRQIYLDLQDRKGGKREVLERILEGDWRHGIALRQLAMADLRYRDDHPSSLRWTALELERIDVRPRDSDPADTSLEDWATKMPRTRVSTFVKSLQKQISPLLKAHFHVHRSRNFPLTYLRIFLLDTPYQSPQQSPEVFLDTSRVIYVAFPDSCPFIYSSVFTPTGAKTVISTSWAATDARSLQRLVRDEIPQALSRPNERYILKSTALTTKNLTTLLALRGPGRTTAANGAFSIFADAAIEGSPLDLRPSHTVPAEEHMHGGSKPALTHNEVKEDPMNAIDNSLRQQITSAGGNDDGTISPKSKKRRLATDLRFGTAGGSKPTAPLDRLDVRLLDQPSDTQNQGNANIDRTPPVTLTFTGSDVFGGIRKLAELGFVDPERMPSWMTGEEGISTAEIHRGKRVKSSV